MKIFWLISPVKLRTAAAKARIILRLFQFLVEEQNNRLATGAQKCEIHSLSRAVNGIADGVFYPTAVFLIGCRFCRTSEKLTVNSKSHSRNCSRRLEGWLSG
jgi:hypothetical protein